MMQLRIVHVTGFEYAGRAAASYNQARLTPLTSEFQIVIHHRIEISPHPWAYEYLDYFGTRVTAFEVAEPHSSLTVTASSTMQVSRPAAAWPELSWEDLSTPEVADRWTEYLVLPELVAPPADFAAEAKAIATACDNPALAAREICSLVHTAVEYAPGATEVETSASEVWRQRAGISQDMVHLAIGGLRSAGIPARYVSGYSHPSEDPVVGETLRGNSHAWLEFWDGSWKPFDPTNASEPGDTYVAVAKGRDYTDVRPLAGIYSGAETSKMTAYVDITRLA